MAGPERPKKEREVRKPMAADGYVSQFFIDPANLDTENYHYRWVETHCMNAETQSLGIALRAGYEPVSLADLPEFAKTAELMTAIRGRKEKDEFVRQGDQILMRCPREFYEKSKKAERKLAKQQMNRVDWAEQSSSIKAPTFVTDMSYSRTQEMSKAAAKAFADEDD